MERIAYSVFAKAIGTCLLVCSIILAFNLLQGEPAAIVMWLTHQALHIEVDLYGYFDKMLTVALITIIAYCAVRALFYNKSAKV
ncbi:hypothetical protein [Thalassotalea sediminis]|uniref:hypothetical protein n=1 Tax=Thalassotalea sediminis TaxID=1759089 RepID=UPI0025744C58|nr:hypothetical protein [Thalassotalea sediminis]